jgi:hypothetical protein
VLVTAFGIEENVGLAAGTTEPLEFPGLVSEVDRVVRVLDQMRIVTECTQIIGDLPEGLQNRLPVSCK